jgi:cytoskeletal protein CcmA (bactofilin family)
MFEKQKNTSTEDLTRQKSAPPIVTDTRQTPVHGNALIGASIKISGDISGQENLTIEGTVEGNIEFTTNEVSIGSAGRVDANITAKIVRVDGAVNGDINGHEKVVISRTGKVQGNIVAPRVTLEDGAQFKGRIDMDPTESKPAGAAAADFRTASKSSVGEKDVPELNRPTTASSGA